MSAIFLIVLQILLLLLKAHLSRNHDYEKAIAAIKEAQDKLADLASNFEAKVRYSEYPKENFDRLQNAMDEARKANEARNDF